MDVDWTTELTAQLEWHWTHQLRPRLRGLTDKEYFWEPVAGCWNVRPRGESAAHISADRRRTMGHGNMRQAPLKRWPSLTTVMPAGSRACAASALRASRSHAARRSRSLRHRW